MQFDPTVEDVVVVKQQTEKGTCHFRGKILFSQGYHSLFTSKFHQDRSTLHVIAAILERYPDGAYFKQYVQLNNVDIIVMDRNKKTYIFLQSEVE